MESKTQVELLHQISNIVSSNLTLEKMLQQLVALTVEVTSCDACLVYLLDRHRKEIVLRASQLPHTKEIGHIRMKMGEGITGWVAQHKSVVALGANASADTRFKSFQKLPEDTYEAFLSVPLVSAGGSGLVITSAALGLLSKLTVFRIKRWSECNTCKICEKACEWGAIRGPKIVMSECVRCDDCERLYMDTKKCPHWLIIIRKSDIMARRSAIPPPPAGLSIPTR